MHSYKKIGHKTFGTTAWFALLSLTLVVMLGAFAVSHTSAQTDFNIQGTQPKLEQEYKEELDKWMLRAYEGDRDAQFKVGVLFTNKQFNEPDYEQAVYWYKQAARQNHVLAQYNLGHQYLSGVGVAKSENDAMEWWLKAAKQGHALAQFNIGRAYYLGIGLAEDQTQSRDWFERAARNGEPKSIEILEQLGWAKKGQYTEQMAGASSIGEGVSTTNNILAANSLEAPVSASAAASTVKNIAPRPDSKNDNNGDKVSNEANAPKKTPIALYTDPSIRSVLIAIINARDELTLEKEDEVWSTVTSRVGFPVWVHGDFINVVDDDGVVSGDAVNARSVPIVTNGTIVGRLNRKENVKVLDKRNDWYRVVAPQRFKAWVKTADFKAAAQPVKETQKPDTSETSNATPLTSQASDKTTTKSKSNTNNDDNNDNAWLFEQPADSYTLQLASFDDEATINEFLSRAKFADNPELHRFTAQGKDISWTYFLYGEYDNRDNAELAKQSINQKRAWIRSFGRLQQNRCVAWKKQLPTPKELNTYCVE